MSLSRNDPEMFEMLASDTPKPSESLTVPLLTYNDNERLQVAVRLKKTLTEETNALNAYVILKQSSDIIDKALEITKEDAISKVNGKSELIMGAKVELKRSKKYEYIHPRLIQIGEEVKKLKEEEKKLKSLLESMTEPMAYGTSGEMIEPAKLIQDGTNLFITLIK